MLHIVKKKITTAIYYLNHTDFKKKVSSFCTSLGLYYLCIELII